MSSMKHFHRDFASRLWFTYRKDFPAIEGTQLTSDMGWGCMLRSSQMMMAHAFVCHFMGRGMKYIIKTFLFTHMKTILLFSYL